jgi:hypothetical protein
VSAWEQALRTSRPAATTVLKTRSTAGSRHARPDDQLLALNATLGNAAVARLLQRQGTLPTAPPGQPHAPTAPAPGTLLPPAERGRIQEEAADHVTQAMPAFATACAHHRDALRSAARASAEMTALVIDIATGFLAPAFARWAANTAARSVADRLPAAVAPAVENFMKNGDNMKASFTAASKIGQTVIKQRATTLFGETDHDRFLTTVQNAFHEGGQAITDSLRDPSVTDQQVLAVWYGYRYEHTNIDVYRDAIGNLLRAYDSFIRAQGTQHFEPREGNVETGAVDYETRVYMADLYGRPRPILVRTIDAGIGTPERRFVGYVPESVTAMAIAETRRLFGRVETIDPGTISGHIPAP